MQVKKILPEFSASQRENIHFPRVFQVFPEIAKKINIFPGFPGFWQPQYIHHIT